MGALAAASTGRGWEDAGRDGAGTDRAGDARPAQPRLFALPGGAVEAAPPAPEPVGRTAVPAARVPTLDDAVTGAWRLVAEGAAAPCPLCGGSLRPRWSAGAGAVGGRCTDCGTVLD